MVYVARNLGVGMSGKFLQMILPIVAIMAALVGILYVGAGYRFTESYQKLEQDALHENFHRIQDLLADDLTMLSSQVGDWACWDESYDFVETGNPAFLTRNIPDSTFKDIKVNLITFIDKSGRSVYEGWYDWKTGTVSGSKVSLQNHLGADSRLLNHTFPSSSVTGIIILSEGPLLVASRPILDSKRSGPIRGTLIMGRFLDDVEIDRLSKASRVSFAVGRLDDPYLSSEFSGIQSRLSSSATVVKETGDNELVAYGLLKDLYGKPALILKTKIRRDITREGEKALASFRMLLLVVGGIGIVLVVMLLRRLTAVSPPEARHEEHGTYAPSFMGSDGDCSPILLDETGNADESSPLEEPPPSPEATVETAGGEVVEEAPSLEENPDPEPQSSPEPNETPPATS